MQNISNIIYAFLCLFLTIVVGGAVYEHAAVVPQWSAAPPASLSMYQGDYGLNPGAFWARIHPVVLLFFVTCTILFWKTPRRKNLLVAFGGYFLVMVITFTFFVPELMAITSTAYAETVDQELVERASRWEMLSIIRLFFIIGLAIYLFLGLTKTNDINLTTNG